jgi:hypothetical protein
MEALEGRWSIDPHSRRKWMRGGRSDLSPRRAGKVGPLPAPGEFDNSQFHRISQKEKRTKKERATTAAVFFLIVRAYAMRIKNTQPPWVKQKPNTMGNLYDLY